jgi:hypothetical protein
MTVDRSAAARWTDKDVDPGESEEQVAPCRGDLQMRDLRNGVLIREASASDLKLGVDVGGGDEAVVADLDEARRQDVKQESAHELDTIDGGGVAVLGAEAHVASVEADEALI